MVEPGVVINDRFRVVKIIGEGGMGAVFEGEHTGVGRKVAIKVLHPEYARNSEIVGRFQREARSAAAIGHDNIIEILDFGVHENAPYMVMEFLKGESLGGRMERLGAVPIGSAAYIMTQMLSALAAAHAVGIIHRDLKPDNVFLITKAGHRDFVKLLDFGIAKLKAEDNKPETKGLTQTGAVMGTPYYMAPEQALGKRELDHRADIYSAGVMLYQMVTGQVPFDAESQAELLMAIVYRINGLKSPREINAEIPPEFEAIILKAMDKDIGNRYADAGEFAMALEPFITPPGIASADSTGSMRVPPVGPAVAKTLTPATWEKPAVSTQPDGSRVEGTGGTGMQAVSPPVAVPAVPVAKSRTGVFAAVGAVALLAIVAGIAVPRLSSPPSQPVRTIAAQSANVPVLVPSTVALDLDGVPADGVLFVDGQPSASPHLTFERGSQHTVRVTAPGKLPYERAVVADRDRSISIALADAPVVIAAAPDAGITVAEAPVAVVAQPHGRGGNPAAHATGHTPVHAPAHTTTAPRGNGNPLLPVSNEF